MKARKFRINHALQSTKWMLVLYDFVVLALVCMLMLGIYGGSEILNSQNRFLQAVIIVAFIFTSRFVFKIYKQIWRYGGIQSYVLLMLADLLAFVIYYIVEAILPIQHIAFARQLALFSINLLGALAMRMIYRYAYKFGDDSPVLSWMLRVFGGIRMKKKVNAEARRIKVAIIGAGTVGTNLAEDLLTNASSTYSPRFFIDSNPAKTGRIIHGIPVYSEKSIDESFLKLYEIQEVIVAIPTIGAEEKKRIYERYRGFGCIVKVFDFPIMQKAGPQKMQLRDFDVEELLFRKPIVIEDNSMEDYYRDRVILITGGGGSIGSEISRQLAGMQPKKLIILDIAENGAYDIQQELLVKYGRSFPVCVEIVSVTNREGLTRVFEEYHPEIVVMAAAHKHVPLMEKNCIEAVENNVFGTLNTVEIAEQYGVSRVIMVSTDKAVNPTNVMGATKRMCEMIVQAYSTAGSKTVFSATRFGNVLGSAGSVIPLFKKQIAMGGPVTITDKRIIRYFMTISEASRLVLQSGALAKNGELFVLDMGEPVKILDLAMNMIRLSGLEPGTDIEVRETGLRPGEKLYEELLIRTEEMDTTENRKIFIERDQPLPKAEIQSLLKELRAACDTGSDEAARAALKNAVPTYHSPEKVNAAKS